MINFLNTNSWNIQLHPFWGFGGIGFEATASTKPAEQYSWADQKGEKKSFRNRNENLIISQLNDFTEDKTVLFHKAGNAHTTCHK